MKAKLVEYGGGEFVYFAQGCDVQLSSVDGCSSCGGCGEGSNEYVRCHRCHGSGEVSVDPYVDGVECSCGAEYDILEYEALEDGRCVCGLDLCDAVESALAAAERATR